VIPIAKAKEPQPGTLNRGRITGSRSTPTALMKPVPFSRFDATKKGKREGNTMLSHRLSPLAAEFSAVFEKMMRHSIKSTQTAGNTSLRKYITLYILAFKKINIEMMHKTAKMQVPIPHPLK